MQINVWKTWNYFTNVEGAHWSIWWKICIFRSFWFLQKTCMHFPLLISFRYSWIMLRAAHQDRSLQVRGNSNWATSVTKFLALEFLTIAFVATRLSPLSNRSKRSMNGPKWTTDERSVSVVAQPIYLTPSVGIEVSFRSRFWRACHWILNVNATGLEVCGFSPSCTFSLIDMSTLVETWTALYSSFLLRKNVGEMGLEKKTTDGKKWAFELKG